MLCAASPAVALAAAARSAPARPAAATARSTAVGVSEREFRLMPYRTRVPAGDVRFNVTNFGEDRHDLVVRTTAGRVLARLPEVAPGDRAVLRVRLRPGRYRLSCDVADHARRGMRATFAVSRPTRARR